MTFIKAQEDMLKFYFESDSRMYLVLYWLTSEITAFVSKEQAFKKRLLIAYSLIQQSATL